MYYFACFWTFAARATTIISSVDVQPQRAVADICILIPFTALANKYLVSLGYIFKSQRDENLQFKPANPEKGALIKDLLLDFNGRC